MKNSCFSLKWIVLSVALLSSLELVAQRYEPVYKTIGHKVLDVEYKRKKIIHPEQSKLLEDSLATQKKLLDHFIANCLKVCPDVRPGMTRNEVLQIMQNIDSSLYAMGAYTCVAVDKFSEVFVPMSASLRLCYKDCHDDYSYNGYRNAYKQCLDTFYKMDCDLSSIIYLSVAELKHYPMFYIEVPKHNFVRWRFSDSSFLNWDTNLAAEKTDSLYRIGRSGAVSIGFNAVTEANMFYLKDRDSNYILAEWYALEGLDVKRERIFKSAIDMYNTSLKYDFTNFRGMHFLAWLYLYYPQFENAENTAMAYKYAKLVYNMKREDYDNTAYIETYGCACAAVGDFDKAYSIVAAVSKDSVLIAGLKAKKKCNVIYRCREK